jgi:hypothetical protein
MNITHNSKFCHLIVVICDVDRSGNTGVFIGTRLVMQLLVRPLCTRFTSLVVNPYLVNPRGKSTELSSSAPYSYSPASS